MPENYNSVILGLHVDFSYKVDTHPQYAWESKLLSLFTNLYQCIDADNQIKDNTANDGKNKDHASFMEEKKKNDNSLKWTSANQIASIFVEISSKIAWSKFSVCLRQSPGCQLSSLRASHVWWPVVEGTPWLTSLLVVLTTDVDGNGLETNPSYVTGAVHGVTISYAHDS